MPKTSPKRPLEFTALEDRTVPAGDGLSAIFFDNAAIGGGGQRDFTGPSVSRVETDLAPWWGDGSPAPGAIGPDTFTARYAGRVEAPATGDHRFGVSGDNGVRLWVNDTLIIDRWTDTWNYFEESNAVRLEAGRKYHIVFEYFENGGGAGFNLQWKRPGDGAYSTIPASVLYSDEKVYPSSAVVNVKSQYGAVGDGIADDTEALQRAISDNLDGSRMLYLPNGTYKVSQTLQWRHRNADGTWVTTGFSQGWGAYLGLQGQNRDNTVIKLADNRFTAEPGYGTPNAVLYTASRDDDNRYDDVLGSGNQGFANNLFDLTVHTGSGNSGAVGVDYLASNWGAIDNVAVVSGDGAGYAGVRFVRRDGGPALMQELAVRGFARGVEIDPAGGITTLTIEHLRLRGQSEVGLTTFDSAVSVRDVDSLNSVTAIRNTGGVSLLTVVDATLVGGSPSNPAIYSSGLMLGRNLSSAGYAATLRNDRDGTVTNRTGAIGEFTTYAPLKEFGDSAPTTLNLAVKETPEYFDRNQANWADAGAANGSDDTAAIQAALNSGKSTVFFRAGGRYHVRDTLTVPASVQHLYGAGATFIPAAGHLFGDAANPRPVFRFVGGTASEAVLFENFKTEIGTPGTIGVMHDSPRTLTLKNAAVSGRDGFYSVGNTAAAGELFLEDAAAGVRQTAGRKVWARQLNSEVAGGVVNRVAEGGTLWVLGVKTEGDVTVIDARPGSRVELLGGNLYPVGPPSRAAFTSQDASVSLSYTSTAYNFDHHDYPVHVRETRGGETRELKHGEAYWRGYGRNVPLYAGHVASAPFGGTPRALPGTIQAEDFDDGGQGVAYSDADASNNGGDNYRPGQRVDVRGSSDAGGGRQIGWIVAGEWLKYTAQLGASGNYDISFRVSSGASGGTLHLEDGTGRDLTGPLSFGNTGGWDTFATVTKYNVPLAAGRHTFRVVFDSGALDFNWWAVTTPANRLSNAGFEDNGGFTQSPAGWGTWSPNGSDAADYAEPSANSHSGGVYGVHWSASAYEVVTYQRKNVENGTYRASAWVRSSGGQDSAQFYAGRFQTWDGTWVGVPIPAGSGWTLVTLDDLQVTNGHIEVALGSKGSGGQWITFDDVELIRVG